MTTPNVTPWRYLIVTEEYDVFGTNDEKRAKFAATWAQVYDTQTGEALTPHCEPIRPVPDEDFKDVEAPVQNRLQLGGTTNE
jgi:hypothetical protein